MRLAAALLLWAASWAVAADGPEPRVVESVLSAQLPGEDSAWLLVAADGRRWQRGFSDGPILPGSLLKPFAALAWLESHPDNPPTYECDGQGCWLPSGHGDVGLAEALAHSCNSYFSRLIRRVRFEQVAAVALHYGLPPPPANAPDGPDAWWGWGDAWPVRAAELLEAFQELGRRRHPANALVLSGLLQAAEAGTGAEAGRALSAPAWVKTGTAPCKHARKRDGDGLAIVLYPPSNPRYTMLLQACGRTGREAAAATGLVLGKLADGHPRPTP